MKRLLTLLLVIWSLTATAQRHPFSFQNAGYVINQVPPSITFQDSWGAIAGDGVDGIVQIPHNSLYNFDRTNAFTISLAVNFNATDLATSSTVLSKFDLAGVKGWQLQKISSKLRFALIGASGNSITVDASSFTFTSSKWYHIAVTHDGSSSTAGVRAYVNGVQIALTSTQNTLTLSTTNTKPIDLFHRDATAGFGREKISHVQIFDTALTNDQCGNLWGGLLFDKNPIAHYSSTVLNWFAEDMTFSSPNYSGPATVYTAGVPSTITVASVNIATGSLNNESMDGFDETNLIVDTRGLGHLTRLVNFVSVYPQTCYSPRTLRTYREYMEKGGTDAHNVKRFFYWDHQNNKPSKIYTAGTGTLLEDDGHLCTSFFESATGYQLMAYEPKHNTSVVIKRTTVKDDPETFVQVATLQSGATNNSTSPLPVSYPYFKQFKSGEIWLFFRHGRSQVSYSKSLDDGLTWSSMIVIANGDRNGAVGGTESNLNWTYPFPVESHDDNIYMGITHTGSASAGDASNLYFLSYIQSVDKGVTWTNVSGSFSKTAASGIVTYAELLASCKVDDQYSIRSIDRSPNGTVYMFGEDISGNDYLWYYSGGSWTRKAITFTPVTLGDTGTLLAEDNLLTLICLETVSGKNLPGIRTSTDQGDNWTFVRRLSVDQTKNYLLPSTPLGFMPPEKRLYVAGQDTGNLLITP
jgi:hypothetical protein